MKPSQRQEVRQHLLTHRAMIREDGNVSLEVEDDGTVVRKPDEDTAPLVEMNQVIASTRNRARAARLREIEAALARLEQEPETFGLCDDCEEPIPFRRLQLMPWARLCIECQNERERNESPKGRKHITDYR